MTRDDHGGTGTRNAVFPTPGNFSSQRRLHPAAMIVRLVQNIRSLISTVLSLLVFSGMIVRHLDSKPLIIVLVTGGLMLLVFELAQPTIQWLTTRYQLGKDAITLRSGLFSRTQRTIAYSTIHAINSVSPWYLRPFGVVRLTIASAGSDEASIVLDAVPAHVQLKLERLRNASTTSNADDFDDVAEQTNHTGGTKPDNFGVAPIDVADPPVRHIATHTTHTTTAVSDIVSCQGRLVFRARPVDIVLYSLTDIGLLAAAGVLYGFVTQVADALPHDVLDQASGMVYSLLMHGVLIVVLMLLGCVVMLLLVGIGLNFLRFYGFEVRRCGDDLVVTRGLLTRRATTMAVSRIQTVSIKYNPLRELIHLCAVEVGLSATGSGDSKDDKAGDATVILPVVSYRNVYTILNVMLPEWKIKPPASELHHTGKGLLHYYLFQAVLRSLMIAAAGTGIFAVSAYAVPSARILLLNANVILTVLLGSMGIVLPVMLWARWYACHTEGYQFVDRQGIVVTGTSSWTRFTMFTSRPRAQSCIRKVPLWRVRKGVERLSMPLYVLNGTDELKFSFLCCEDADHLECWFRGQKMHDTK